MGVRITTGYTATASRDVTLTYKCSHCGADNRATQRLEGIGHTDLFFGKPTNPGYREDAQACLRDLMKELCKEKPSERYVDAEFDCKCTSCGKREPWAKLRYGYIKKLRVFILWVTFFSFTFFVSNVTPIPFLLSLAALIWTFCHEPMHRKRMYAQIDALPQESLPRITVDLNGVTLELAPESKSPAPAKPEPPKPEPPKPEPPKPEPPKPLSPPEPVRPAEPVRKPEPVVLPEQKQLSVLLTLNGGPKSGSRFRCREGNAVFVGRDPSRCNLPLSGYSAVSGLHCRMEITGGRLMVTDLGSTNGTFVNGTRLAPNQPASVPNGGEIRLANPECVFRVQYE